MENNLYFMLSLKNIFHSFFDMGSVQTSITIFRVKLYYVAVWSSFFLLLQNKQVEEFSKPFISFHAKKSFSQISSCPRPDNHSCPLFFSLDRKKGKLKGCEQKKKLLSSSFNNGCQNPITLLITLN